MLCVRWMEWMEGWWKTNGGSLCGFLQQGGCTSQVTRQSQFWYCLRPTSRSCPKPARGAGAAQWLVPVCSWGLDQSCDLAPPAPPCPSTVCDDCSVIAPRAMWTAYVGDGATFGDKERR